MSCRRVSGVRGGRGEFQVSASDGVHRYVVAVDATDALLCPCAGFTYRRACRHSAEAAMGLLRERGVALPDGGAVSSSVVDGVVADVAARHGIATTRPPVRAVWDHPYVDEELDWITAYAPASA